MSAPFKKNDDISPEITGMTAECAGVGRHEGFAVFVPGALPGERVNAHIIKVASNYAVGKLTGVIEASKDRVDPACPAASKCGGCALQHMSYPAQLDFKRGLVRDALIRIGGFNDIEVKPVIGMDDPMRYRNKGSFPFAEQDGRIVWGLYAPRSHRLISVKNCLIEHENAVNAAEAVCDWANEFGVPAFDETAHRGILRHVVTRCCTGGTAVCVVTTGKLPKKDELISRLKAAVPDLRSVVHNINNEDTNVICGREYRLIYGDEAVVHTLCGLEFFVSAESFLQVNTVQTEKLYRLAVDGLKLDGHETAADVFCGIGTITLMLAQRAKKAAGVEYVEKAVMDARKNAEHNGIANAEFYAGAAEAVLPRLVEDGMKLDAVVLDPPRKGADEAVLKAIAESGAEKIAYVSCDPATLARDCRILSGYGFEIVSVQPVDMFPFTGHVESVVLMSRGG